jgi:hypothetical protein
MSYTGPTITASSGTFAQLKTGGLKQQLELLIAANSGLTQGQINQIRALLKVDGVSPILRAAGHIDNWLHGDPVADATVAQQVLDYATVFATLATALNEVGTLLDANKGTVEGRARTWLVAGSATAGTPAATTVALTCTPASGGKTPYSYQWYRSPTTGFTPDGTTALAGKNALSWTNTGLTAATNYYYKVVARDAAGFTATTAECHVLTASS